MKSSYKFEKEVLKLIFIPNKTEGVDCSGKVKMGRYECNIHTPKDWDIEKIHPDVLALIIILIAYPFIDKEIEVPIGVSQDFHDSFKKETKKSIYPVDKNLKPRIAPKNAVPGLAYSGGVDSTAALALLPSNTVCFFLDRILPKELEKSLKLYDKQSVYDVYSQLEKQGRQGYKIKTDLEYVRVPRGFPVETSTTIPALLLSDYIGIDSVATGTIMEHQYIPYHKISLDRDYFVKWNNIFKSIDIPLNQVTAGISEVGTMKILLNSPYSSFNHWCMRGDNSRPCMKCDKCFRKKILEMILLKQQVPNSMLDNLFLSNEVRTMLKQLPIPCENVIAYITSHYNGNHTLMKSLKKRTRANILDTSWMEKWYSPAKDLIAEKYYNSVEKEIIKHLEVMSSEDEANMNSWDITSINNSLIYQKYQQDFISDLTKFKQDTIRNR
ncbi:DUF6395 domain-containing protein [Tissierella sp. MB52-C2]|uniref:DUF6395 domain-containing protein n=1 Tax=Tissierella sp. MB52-C2 TaxID=3070999 RepID=UPI00280AD74E|nr:DUF6395 domain-containing protein [Tissierella sp. MB52-C2]WMM23278.1 DUF6395 domain-containing protein [Tissierella sp. MB52-C2]